MITTYMVRLFAGLKGIAFVNLLGGEGFKGWEIHAIIVS